MKIQPNPVMDVPAANSLGGGSSADTNERQKDAPGAASDWLHSYLKRQMTVSKRTGCWFRLEKRERSMFSLALRLKASFRGYGLLKAMVSVLDKLAEVSGIVHGRLMRGVRMALAFSAFAVEWGNRSARSWRNDLGYARYLGLHMCEGKHL